MRYSKYLYFLNFIVITFITHLRALDTVALLLPTTPPTSNYQVLSIVNISNGQLDWISTITSTEEFQLLYTATSADIPLTLVLRDSIGNFAATDITVESLIVTPTNIQGCIIFTDSANNTSGNICANQHALLIAPVAPRALQASDDDIARGISAVDLQMSYLNSAEVASGDYAVITGGQNNSAAAPYTVATGGLSNIVTNSYAVIAGGLSNQVSGNNSFIGTGSGNIVSGNYSALISGTLNSVTNNWSALGAGLSNTLSGSNSLIGAGADNTIAFIGSGILAGYLNTINNNYNFIGSGEFNNASGASSCVLTGSGNTSGSNFTACGAGQSNTVVSNSFIGGGTFNSASASSCGVLAGSANAARIARDVVLAGYGQYTHGDADTFIGAGVFNMAEGTSSVFTGSINNATGTGMGLVLCGVNNTVSTSDFVAGGANNAAGNTFQYCFAGANNTGLIQGIVISGQYNNARALYSIIGAGTLNTVTLTNSAAILAGSSNIITADFGMILGGQNNTTTESCIACGYFNSATSAGGIDPVVGCILSGSGNSMSKNYCVVLVGQENNCTSGNNALASGTQATASLGTFLWTDHSTTTSATVITTNNKFVVRAAGGSYIFTNSTATSGVQLAPGGGSWNNLSDKALKTHYSDIEPVVLLDKLSCMPILEWSFKAQEPTFRHIGPLAQDFHALFDYHEQPLALNTADALGILYAAYKGLYRLTDSKKKYNERISDLETIINDLENMYNCC